jgi:Ca-activated chloride channel family protein
MLFRPKVQRHMILEPPRPPVSAWWRWFRYFFVLIVTVVIAVLVLAARSASAAGEPAVGRGELLFASDDGEYQSAVQLHSKVHLQISGMVAQVQLEQRFRNATGQWLEAVYVFPLPENSAVNQLRLVIGERVIIGAIKERTQARKIYQQARREGRKAGLVEQQRPNMFTSRVANVAPGEEVTVQLRYVQRIDYHEGEFSLRFPMTITPRYIPGQPLGPPDLTLLADTEHGWAAPTDQVPDAAAITPPLQGPAAINGTRENSIEIRGEIDVGMPLAAVESVYHAIKLTRSEGRYHLELAQSADGNAPVSMNRDFVLRWRPQAGSEPQAALFREQVDGEHYALLMVVPPRRLDTVVLPREMIFVIDSSGSMGGSSIAQARQSLQFALGKLRSRDRFNIVEFNSSARSLFISSQPASDHNVARAREFVRHLDAGGGTEMLKALRLALHDAPVARDGESALLRQVVFITDGAVGNETALFQDIRQRLGRSRLFTVGIGSAPNSWFMRKAAEVGRGTATFIGDTEQVRQQMEDLFDSLSTPLVSDIEIHWPHDVESYPGKVPDLYRGQPVLVAARLLPRGAEPQAGNIIVSGRSAGGDWQRQLVLSAPDTDTRGAGESLHQGVASVWARQKIAELLDGKILGKPESSIRAAVLPVALAHQLVSPYTSFVAVEQQPSRPATESLKSEAVPNVPPKGQSPQPYAWPKTATGVRTQLALGTVLLLLSLLLWGVQLLKKHVNCAT